MGLSWDGSTSWPTAQGKIIPSGYSKVIQPYETGVIASIQVQDGQVVKQGNVLIELDPTQNQADRDRAFNEYRAARVEAARLQALIAGSAILVAPPESDPQYVRLQQQLLRDQLAEYQARVEAASYVIAQRKAAVDVTVENIRRLDATVPMETERAGAFKRLIERDAVTKLDYLQAEGQRIDKLQELAGQQHKLRQDEAALAEAEKNRWAMVSEFQQTKQAELSATDTKAASLSQEVTKAGQQGRTAAARGPDRRRGAAAGGAYRRRCRDARATVAHRGAAGPSGRSGSAAGEQRHRLRKRRPTGRNQSGDVSHLLSTAPSPARCSPSRTMPCPSTRINRRTAGLCHTGESGARDHSGGRQTGPPIPRHGGDRRNQDRSAATDRISVEPRAEIAAREFEGTIRPMSLLPIHVRWLLLVLSLAVILDTVQSAWATEAEQATKVPVQEVHLSLRAAMAAAAQQNPSVLLSRERIEAAKGEVTTQLGAMLPNLSANVRESQQTQCLRHLRPRAGPDRALQHFRRPRKRIANLYSLSLIQRWRASREALQVRVRRPEQPVRYDGQHRAGLPRRCESGDGLDDASG